MSMVSVEVQGFFTYTTTVEVPDEFDTEEDELEYAESVAESELQTIMADHDRLTLVADDVGFGDA